MPVAEPFIDSKALLDNSPKEELRRRLMSYVSRLQKNIKDYGIHMETYKKELDKHEKILSNFQAELDSCMNEEEVRKLCSKVGV